MRIAQLANFVGPTSGGMRRAVDQLGEGYVARGHDRILIIPGPKTLVRDTPALVAKLQKLDPAQVTQDQLIDHADEMGLGLMTDDAAGSIIIMDAKDAAVFVNLLNDDYVTSDLTGVKYEMRGKKILRENEQLPE